MLTQLPEVLAHLSRTGGAVQSDHVDSKWFKRSQRRTNLTTEQHGAGGFHCHFNEDWQSHAGLNNCQAAGIDSSFGLEQVLAGFNHEGIAAAGD